MFPFWQRPGEVHRSHGPEEMPLLDERRRARTWVARFIAE
jgi:hypothetical protein